VLFGLGAVGAVLSEELLYSLVAVVHALGLVIFGIATRRMAKGNEEGPGTALKALVAVMVIRAVWYGTTAAMILVMTGLMSTFALSML
jgi:hypothetical protein